MTDLSTPQSRAQRLTSLRKRVGISRRKLGELADVSYRNLENWEYARFHGLSEKGAQKIVEGFRAIGCECTIEWLLHGLPPTPRVDTPIGGIQSDVYIIPSTDKPEHIQTELSLLKKHIANLIEYQIQDHSMEPLYLQGDYIAGSAVALHEQEKFLSKPCIIQLADHTTLVRKVTKGDKGNYYNLVAYNQSEGIKEPYIYNIKPLLVAPVIWVRRFLNP